MMDKLKCPVCGEYVIPLFEVVYRGEVVWEVDISNVHYCCVCGAKLEEKEMIDYDKPLGKVTSWIWDDSGSTIKVTLKSECSLMDWYRICGMNVPMIRDVIFNYPATIIIWGDGKKTVVKCSDNDEWDPEKGFMAAYLERFLGKTELHKLYKKWVKPQEELERMESVAAAYQFFKDGGFKDMADTLTTAFKNLGINSTEEKKDD